MSILWVFVLIQTTVPAALGGGLAIAGTAADSALLEVLNRRVGGDRLERTEALIGERNHAAMAQLKEFYVLGWQVQEQIPWRAADSNNAWSQPWTELRLSTTDVPEQELERVAAIFRESTDRRLRAMVIDAIGRSQEIRAQELLVELYALTQDEVELRQILGRVRPRSNQDALAEFLMNEARNRQRSMAIRRQAAATLVLELGGADGRGLASSAGSDSVFPSLLQTIWGETP